MLRGVAISLIVLSAACERSSGRAGAPSEDAAAPTAGVGAPSASVAAEPPDAAALPEPTWPEPAWTELPDETATEPGLPSLEDARSVLVRLNYDPRTSAYSEGTFEIEAASAEGARAVTVRVVSLHEEAARPKAEEAACAQVVRGKERALVVEVRGSDGSPDAASAIALKDALVGGVGKAPRSAIARPPSPPAFKLRDLAVDADKADALLALPRATHLSKARGEGSGVPPTTTVYLKRDGLYVQVKIGCSPAEGPAFPAPAEEVGSAIYEAEGCKLAVRAKPKHLEASEVDPRASRRNLAEIFSLRPPVP